MAQMSSNKTTPADLDIAVFSSVKDVPAAHWSMVCAENNMYCSLAYLDAIESSLHHEINFRYLIFYNQVRQPVAIAIVQVLPLFDKGFKEQQQLCRIRDKIKNMFLASSGLTVLTCGSPFSCGENGFMFTKDITAEYAYAQLSKALINLQKADNKTLNAPVTVVKEFWPPSVKALDTMKDFGYRDFNIDVNMVMAISEDWKCFEDYLFSMVTKFRTKAKSAFKKSAALRVVDFQEQDVMQHKDQIYTLYRAVLEKSPFQFGALNGDTFVKLKRNLGDQFSMQGYFLEDELVGFNSAFIFHGIVDANYVGINYNLNQEYAIYQRMLYDYVALAIDRQCKELRFGRTAEEIKSTVGALPVNMTLAIRHRNPIKNALLKSVFRSITPSSFEQRNPFKAVYQNVL
jgi:hypothetical protein